MKQWAHDELHDLIGKKPALKKKFDTGPSFNDLHEWFEQIHRMVGVFAEVTGCRSIEDAIMLVLEIEGYVSQYHDTRKGWLGIEGLEKGKHKESLAVIEKFYTDNHLCHSPGGRVYKCYCEQNNK